MFANEFHKSLYQLKTSFIFYLSHLTVLEPFNLFLIGNLCLLLTPRDDYLMNAPRLFIVARAKAMRSIDLSVFQGAAFDRLYSKHYYGNLPKCLMYRINS